MVESDLTVQSGFLILQYTGRTGGLAAVRSPVTAVTVLQCEDENIVSSAPSHLRLTSKCNKQIYLYILPQYLQDRGEDCNRIGETSYSLIPTSFVLTRDAFKK